MKRNKELYFLKMYQNITLSFEQKKEVKIWKEEINA